MKRPLGLRVLVAGAVGQRPGRGGHASLFLQYLMGLRRLGCEVVFVDRLEADMCVGDDAKPCAPDHSVNARYVAHVMAGAGLGGSYAVVLEGGRRTLGMGRDELVAWARRADLLIDVNGYLQVPELLDAPGRRVYLDIDPGFPQMWTAAGRFDGLGRHDAYATFGTDIGTPSCLVPTGGIRWIPTRPPVVLSSWPPCKATAVRRVTSVCTWRGPYDPVEYAGEWYGLRAHLMRGLATLPRTDAAAASGAEFELALDIDAADHGDRALLCAGGWRLVDPVGVAGTPASYRSYIQGSAAELLVPKDIYVRARTGWFSDRSACYLASARPVLALDPGLPPRSGVPDSATSRPRAHAVPTGKGLLSFPDLAGAADAIDDVFSNYGLHADAARSLAEEYFDSDRVLADLLDAAGAIR